MRRFSFDQIARLLGEDSSCTQLIRYFQHDSREVGESDLFFALTGEKVDGHRFLEEIAQKGALGAVVSKEYKGSAYGLNLIYVDNVIQALQLLAQLTFAKQKTRVVAVTGSVGKTTTKDFIATLLQEQFKMTKTPGNMNSQVGLPLFLLNGKGDEEIAVIEMGMSALHEIERLVQIAPPEIAVITKIALAHAAFFPEGMPGIARAKSEIFSSSCLKLGVLNAQAALFESNMQMGNFQKIVYGLETDEIQGEYVLKKVDSQFEIIERGVSSPLFSLPFTAYHLCENFLGAVTIARYLGMEWGDIFAQAQKLNTYKNRFQRVEKEGITFINDSYNANPTSMKAALNNLPKPSSDRKTIAVLTEMRELGSFAKEAHREVGEVAVQRADYLLCTGKDCQPMVELFQQAKKPVEIFLNREEMKRRLFEIAVPGDVVLLKGSNSSQLWKFLEETNLQ